MGLSREEGIALGGAGLGGFGLRLIDSLWTIGRGVSVARKPIYSQCLLQALF